MNRHLRTQRPRTRALALLPLLIAVGAAAGPRQQSASAQTRGASPAPEVERSAAVIANFTPAELERGLAERPQQALEVLLLLAAGLDKAPEPLAGHIQDFLAATGREHGRRLSERGPPWSDTELENLLMVLVVDPVRFAESAEFRERVVPVIERGLDPGVATALRDRLLYALNRLPNFHFRYAERVALAWGAIERSSQPFRIAFNPVSGLAPGGPDRPIVASLYSFPSVFFTPEEVIPLLREIHRIAPGRKLLVLCDAPMRTALEPLASEMPLTLIETFGRPYSPWIRDVMSFRRRPDGRVVLVLRPDTQLGRQDDAHMGQALLQQLPGHLLSGWLPAWTASTIPFHNGQILETEESAWISLHSLKAQLRRATGVDRAPDDGRLEPGSASRYLTSAREAAGELARLLAKPARFVHPVGPDDETPEGFARLLGGASFDLDSVLTLLPGAPVRALVGDPAGGRRLLETVGAAELDRLAESFGLRLRGEELRGELLAAQREPVALELQAFVDTIARHLQGDSIEVARLPLLRIPASALTSPRVDRDFLISWNNVTLERTVEGFQAEGFASPLESGNAIAHAAFERAGYRLHLLPPLVESIARNGGYRCASNHLRELPAPRTAARTSLPAGPS